MLTGGSPAQLLANATLGFLSLEPLQSPLPRLKVDSIDWMIAGGGSGPATPPRPAAARPPEAPACLLRMDCEGYLIRGPAPDSEVRAGRRQDRSVIALWLGHESVETTCIYLHADLALKEEAMARTTPGDMPPERCRPEDEVLAFLNAL